MKTASPFPAELVGEAAALLDACRASQLRIAVAESCTGGLVAALLTEVPGSSDVFDSGCVVYSNEAKRELLGVRLELISSFGAVSAPVARAMAESALEKSRAHLAVAITGVAGPGGGSVDKPVGLVHFACARKGAPTRSVELRFGDLGRSAIRFAAARVAIQMASDYAQSPRA